MIKVYEEAPLWVLAEEYYYEKSIYAGKFILALRKLKLDDQFERMIIKKFGPIVNESDIFQYIDYHRGEIATNLGVIQENETFDINDNFDFVVDE